MTRALDIETPLGYQAFVLTAFSGSEHLARLSEFRVQLKSKRPDITGEQLLGHNVTVRLELAPSLRTSRYFNGYVTRWAGVTEIVDSLPGERLTKAYLYEATIHPWLWFLTRQANSRIFQNRTVAEIVKDVFAGHGGLASFEDKLARSYPRRAYCCQYRETDFNFVSRLMEREGIYYYVRHDNGRHTVVLVDSSAHHTPYPNYDQVRFDLEDRADAEVIGAWSAQYDIQPGKYVVDDYNPETPRNPMSGSAQKQREHPHAQYEIYDHPGGYAKPDDGRQVAGTRLDELQSQYQTFTGSGYVRGFQPGCVFELQRHPVAAWNARHLIVGASYSASVGADSSGSGAGFSFSCQIQAIPANQQYRPPRSTPKPLIQGPQTATVVGPGGEEIYTDDAEHMGCVKVQFRWDRYGKADQNSSCWIRVATPWAGNGYGALAIPRVGHEVVVEFLDGDPDLPLITGSLYNGVNHPPYDLPVQKTRWGLKSRSSPSNGANHFNELRFDDKSGSEEVYLHAERDHHVHIKHDRKERVLNESHLDVAKDSLARFGADRHADIAGDEITRVGGGLHLKVGQDWQASMGTRMAVDAGQEIHLKAGATVVIEAGAQISLKVGGSFITINAAGVFISGAQVMVNSGGAPGSGSGASPMSPKAAEKASGSRGGIDQPMTQKAAALNAARASSTPFCEICNG